MRECQQSHKWRHHGIHICTTQLPTKQQSKAHNCRKIDWRSRKVTYVAKRTIYWIIHDSYALQEQIRKRGVSTLLQMTQMRQDLAEIYS